MSLSTNQQDYIDYLDAKLSAFRSALVTALEADNDQETALVDARTARAALASAVTGLSIALGGAFPNPAQFIVSGDSYQLRRADLSLVVLNASVLFPR